ncbi:MAG: hypothetical protein QM680_13435 [Luteolibacter sp.]
MGRSNRNHLNRIVRAELAGGAETLDAVELFQKISLRQNPQTEAGKIAKLAYETLYQIADAMRAEAALIRREDKEAADE